MEYADYEYYVESYLLGRQPDIPESTFRYYEKQAEKEIDRVTFDRAKRMETPKEVKDCVCDVAELIYKAEQYGGSDAPGPLASYIAGKLTASAAAEEYVRHKKEETTDQMSENDLKRLAKIIQSRPIIVETKLNEKTIAKEIIDPIQEGLDKQKKLRNMIGGVKE